MSKLTIQEAQQKIKDSNLNSRTKIKHHPQLAKVYQFLQRKKVLQESLAHLPVHTNGKLKPKTIYTASQLKKIAKLFKNRTEFKDTNRVAYEQAHNLKIMDQVCAHMEFGATGTKVESKYSNQELIAKAKKYKSRTSMEKKESGPYRTILSRDLQSIAFDHMTSELSRPEAIFQAYLMTQLSQKLPQSTIQDEYWLDDKSRVDLLMEYKNNYYILEVKSEKSMHGWSKKKVAEQMNRYSLTGQKLYKTNFKGAFLISEEGKIGMTLIQFLTSLDLSIK